MAATPGSARTRTCSRRGASWRMTKGPQAVANAVATSSIGAVTFAASPYWPASSSPFRAAIRARSTAKIIQDAAAAGTSGSP